MIFCYMRTHLPLVEASSFDLYLAQTLGLEGD